MKRYRLYIGGEDVDAASGETFEALNPTTGQPVGRDRARATRRTSTARSERRTRRSRARPGARSRRPAAAG